MQKLILGDCLEKIKELPTNSVDAVVTDPPYGLSFMGKKWDHQVPGADVWRECLRVLKPGGHMLVACGTRTQHRMVVNVEDAGFEIRDVVTWLYGSGFPKSLDVSKAIDKAAGAERDVVATRSKTQSFATDDRRKDGSGPGVYGTSPDYAGLQQITAPSTDAAKQWQGWGTALKPACEFWTLARKPLSGTVADNVQEHGTGALNIDGCRVEGQAQPFGNPSASEGYRLHNRTEDWRPNASGRWPANLILDDIAAKMLDEQSGVLKSGSRNGLKSERVSFGPNGTFEEKARDTGKAFDGSFGGASRFFYVAKASKAERNAGLSRMPEREVRSAGGTTSSGKPTMEGRDRFGSTQQNHHPTVKPIKLMRYLCRLITPPSGVVLDPFMGSGSTGVAARLEGLQFIGVEREPEYMAIAEARICVRSVCESE